jgi:hypothetical protein
MLPIRISILKRSFEMFHVSERQFQGLRFFIGCRFLGENANDAKRHPLTTPLWLDSPPRKP